MKVQLTGILIRQFVDQDGVEPFDIIFDSNLSPLCFVRALHLRAIPLLRASLRFCMDRTTSKPVAASTSPKSLIGRDKLLEETTQRCGSVWVCSPVQLSHTHVLANWRSRMCEVSRTLFVK